MKNLYARDSVPLYEIFSIDLDTCDRISHILVFICGDREEVFYFL